MFKNPLKYQQGGTTMQQEKELTRIFSTAASKLQIEPEVLIQKATELQGNEQNAFVQALQDIADSDQPNPKSIQLIRDVFKSNSQSFKEGGKIHDFICKHAKGGIAGCGCKEDGGIVKSQGGNPALGLNFIQREYDGDGNAVYFLAPEKRFLPSNMRQDPDSDYQQQGGEYQGNGQVSIVDFGNGKLRINSDPYGPYGNVLHGADSASYANRALELMSKSGIKPSTGFKVQSNQDGGELTRREALRLGMKNKGYNRAQARLAYQNAKNSIRSQGGRGKEMRQTARQWVVGEMNKPTTAWWQNTPQAQVELPITEQAVQITPEEQANINEIFEKSLVRPYTGNFNQAFANARKDGRSLFLWNNNPYTTELAKSKAPQVDFNSLPNDVQGYLTGNPGDITIEEVPVNENLVDVLDESPTSVWNFMDSMDNTSNEARPIWPINLRKYYPAPIDYSLRGIVYKNGGKVENDSEKKILMQKFLKK